MKKHVKLRVWLRDRYTCHYCGLKDLTEPTVDHVIPRSKMKHGEQDMFSNLVTACSPCNNKKADHVADPPSIKFRAYQLKNFNERKTAKKPRNMSFL